MDVLKLPKSMCVSEVEEFIKYLGKGGIHATYTTSITKDEEQRVIGTQVRGYFFTDNQITRIGFSCEGSYQGNLEKLSRIRFTINGDPRESGLRERVSVMVERYQA
jgi:hypothetical protein